MGICNVVGFVMVEKYFVGWFNKLDCEIVDYYMYCVMGDGCNMEGMFGEGAFFVGYWGFGKLIVFYDDNYIFIDGYIDIFFMEDVVVCFNVYGWYM